MLLDKAPMAQRVDTVISKRQMAQEPDHTGNSAVPHRLLYLDCARL